MEETLSLLLEKDPFLNPYKEILRKRINHVIRLKSRLTGKKKTLPEVASGHEYFGLHFRENEWIFREWAPNADAIYLIGDMTDWKEKKAFTLQRVHPAGHWEIRLPEPSLKHGNLFRLRIHWPGGVGDRIPAYVRRVVQDPQTLIFNAQVWKPPAPFAWKHFHFRHPPEGLFIYEAHIGMAQEEERIGTYREFAEKTLPRIVKAGYNTLQLMAVQEHPYYASFGYQVSNFFAASSRFGTPEDLKALIDAAHEEELCVIIDLIHSHSAPNEVEGLSRFDGTTFQYFHEGPRGIHDAWGSRCFDYAKPEVLHFLLSNCRFWLDEYRLDGFRFDGVTSMLYLHHGLGKAFTSYDDYFGEDVDEDALVYLTLANELIHDINPHAVTIAEDVSGMPGLAAPIRGGGCGFDYRFAMGIPDLWIRLAKDLPDEEWPTGQLWHELNNRRKEEKTISYAESHDQALVGDQTLLFRLTGNAMYHHMRISDENLLVDRGMALHKMIRLITLASAGNGYLNFMGNEFGHPEWIDFPREGNNWSYRYARRQWHLIEDPNLKYSLLAHFDRDMIRLAGKFHLFGFSEPVLLREHFADKAIIFLRGDLLFAFNFHPLASFADYRFEAPMGEYRMILNTDEKQYGGHGRLVQGQRHVTLPEKSEAKQRHLLSLYLPSRSGLVLEKE